VLGIGANDIFVANKATETQFDVLLLSLNLQQIVSALGSNVILKHDGKPQDCSKSKHQHDTSCKCNAPTSMWEIGWKE
jgi:hypothetical protein